MPETKKRPQRPKARYSSHTAQSLKAKLDLYDVSNAQFARVIGICQDTVMVWLSGRADGKMPAMLDLALELGDRDPDIWKREYDGVPVKPRYSSPSLKQVNKQLNQADASV